MKIKKPINTASSAMPVSGGAAIANRLRLDIPSGPSAKNGTISKSAALCALIAGGISLVLAIVLVLVLYTHWDLLMPT